MSITIILAFMAAVAGEPQEAPNPTAAPPDPIFRAMMPPSLHKDVNLSADERNKAMALSDTLFNAAEKRLKRVTQKNEAEIYRDLKTEWLGLINEFLTKHSDKTDNIRKAMVADALHFTTVRDIKNNKVSLQLIRFENLIFSRDFKYSGEGQSLRVD